MITQLRHFSNSWLARIFFVIMAVSFVGWGISGEIFRLMGSPTWIAKVGGQTIEIPDLPGGIPARDGAGDPQPALGSGGVRRVASPRRPADARPHDRVRRRWGWN